MEHRAATPLVAPPTTGEGRIGRYRLIKRLAVGGMADIYLAQQYGKRGYERTVVVKTIRSDLVDEEDLIAMLIEEARIASCLEHENIVELFEVGEEANTQFLAMEFVFGRDLGQIREKCEEKGVEFPPEHIATILIDVLDALFYAHHRATTKDGHKLEVIHRDVSPQNIIVGFDGSVKLLDFGLAKAAAQISRTRAGVLKGKYAYMSPEQVNFKGVDDRADIFSVGVILWEMMTSQRLFYRASDYETVKAVMRCSVPFPKAVRPDVPWDLAWVAWRALRRNPRWRYRDARKMRASLLEAFETPHTRARDQLAEWMAYLFEEQLASRDLALRRARNDPTRHRQILDSGFELLEEVTDPDLRLRPSRAAPATRLPPSTGPLALVAAILGTWRWFLLVFAALVFLSVAAGLYIGSAYDERYGYLDVTADVDGVAVVIGGKALGDAPVDRIPVIPGRHRITGRSRGVTQTVEVRIGPGESKAVHLRFGPSSTP
jgi:serine/threonine protein kinase